MICSLDLSSSRPAHAIDIPYNRRNQPQRVHYVRRSSVMMRVNVRDGVEHGKTWEREAASLVDCWWTARVTCMSVTLGAARISHSTLTVLAAKHLMHSRHAR